MLASRRKSIWFNDKYLLNTIPAFAVYDPLIITDTIEEAIEEHKKEIKRALEFKKIEIDYNFLWFEITTCEIRNKRITWMFTKKYVVKFTDINANMLPNVK